MPKYEFENNDAISPALVLDNDTIQVELGVDGNDSNIVKISVQASAGATFGNPMIQLDPDANGDITLTPNGTGDLIVSSLGEGVVQSSATGVLSSSDGADGQVLIASTAGTPAWANITSADSTLTVTSGANTIDLSITAPVSVPNGGTGAITLTEHGVLVGSGANPIAALAVGTNGQVLLGATGADPAFATLTSTDGTITFTAGANSLDLAANGTIMWNVTTAATEDLASGQGYFANNAGTVTYTLPATAAVGDTFEVCEMNATGDWLIAQRAGQTCYVGNTNTTTGVGGSLASATPAGDWIQIVCRVANTDFQVCVKQGNVTVV